MQGVINNKAPTIRHNISHVVYLLLILCLNNFHTRAATFRTCSETAGVAAIADVHCRNAGARKTLSGRPGKT